MTTEEHPEEAVRAAVVAPVERLEGPDRQRLAWIEQRLLAGARRPRRLPWWWAVVGLGLAAGAGAAYWGLHGGDHAGDQHEPAPSPAAPEAEAATAPGSGDAAKGQSGDTDAVTDEKKDPIIYIGQ